MRLLVFLGVLAVIGLVVTGAIKLQRSDTDTITIQIDKTKVKEDAAVVVERGKEAFSEAESAILEASRDHTTK